MRLTLFYANLLQYKLLKIHITKGKKKQHFQLLLSHCCKDCLKKLCYPLGETDQYKDQSNDILNSIPKDELPDSDSQIERTKSRRGFVIEIKVM